MQPLQYDLRCPAAKDNSNYSITHAAAAPSNFHAAITMHFAAWIYAHGNTRWQQSCSHSNAICNHWFKKRIELRTHEQPRLAEHRARNQLRSERSKPQPPHIGGTFHRRLQPLYTEKRKVSCSGFLPNTSPCNIHAAITMCFAAPRTHPCSHYNAICIHSFQNTEEEPIDLETIQTATAAHRRYLSSLAAATLHGKTQGFVLRLPPQHKPHATFMQPSQCILQHSLHHHFPSSPLPFLTTSLRHHAVS